MFDFRARRNRLRGLLVDNELDGVIFLSEANIFYLTGCTAMRPPAVIVPAEGASVVIVYDKEAETIRQQSGFGNILGWSEQLLPKEEFIAGVLSDMGLDSARMGFEETALTYPGYITFRDSLPDAELVEASWLAQELRMVKTPEELVFMRKASEVTDLAMAAAVNAAKAGRPESYMAREAESVIRDHGLGPTFSPFIGSGPRSALFRRFPRLEPPQWGHLVRIDLGATYFFAHGYGYSSDMTRTVTYGPAPARAESMLELNLAVHLAILENMKPGTTVAEACEAGFAEARGHELEEHVFMGGHGIGLEGHEFVRFHERVDLVIQENMTFAVEPNVILPGEGATCFEDTVVVTLSGAESLTRLPHRAW